MEKETVDYPSILGPNINPELFYLAQKEHRTRQMLLTYFAMNFRRTIPVDSLRVNFGFSPNAIEVSIYNLRRFFKQNEFPFHIYSLKGLQAYYCDSQDYKEGDLVLPEDLLPTNLGMILLTHPELRTLMYGLLHFRMLSNPNELYPVCPNREMMLFRLLAETYPKALTINKAINMFPQRNGNREINREALYVYANRLNAIIGTVEPSIRIDTVSAEGNKRSKPKAYVLIKTPTEVQL